MLIRRQRKLSAQPRQVAACNPAGAVLLVGPWTTADLNKVSAETGREVSRRPFARAGQIAATFDGINFSALSLIAVREWPNAVYTQRMDTRDRLKIVRERFRGPVVLFDPDIGSRESIFAIAAGAGHVNRSPGSAASVIAHLLNQKKEDTAHVA